MARRLLSSSPHCPTPMAKKKTPASAPASAPITVDLPLALIAKIAAQREVTGLSSTSEVVRLAIREFDVGSYRPVVAEHRQISVRLSARMRSFLVQTAKRKKVSVGEVLRAAIEALPAAKRRG
jgi:Arc/MetJ-type ribon-helix-helix transcriptional regulator